MERSVRNMSRTSWVAVMMVVVLVGFDVIQDGCAAPSQSVSSSSSSSASSSSSSDHQFVFYDKRQEEYVKTLKDYVLSVPTRVTSEGNYVTHVLHAKHSVVKREARPFPPALLKDTSGNDVIVNGTDREPSAGYFHDEISHSESDGVIHYRIPVHNRKDVIVRLRENTRLLSPGAVVEIKRRRYLNASDSEFKSLRSKQGCHLTGAVLGDQGSRAALTACDGLTGFFHTQGEEYIIEPVRGHDPASDPHHRHPHVVYKRSALPAHLNIAAAGTVTSSRGGSCGVEDNVKRIVQQRQRWEKNRRSTDCMKSGGQKENESDSKTRRRRKKRSISSEKNTETLVVVDADMMRYYQNENLENYVLTVMNMVSTLFHDASIGNAINIVIVRLLLLKDNDNDLKITHHAEKTLRSFCKWQKNVNFRDDDHPNHHDVAVLLTRKNICNRMNQPCSTLGLSQVSGMCQPHRSCNINEDTGLSLAWTVTHELGHNFGMKHDTKQNHCHSPPGEMYVMAPHLSWDLTPTRWSYCSKKSITKFLDRDWGYCLEDEPGHHDFEYPVLPAGAMYDADHQCRLLYGQGAALCGGIQDLENICSTLWCRVNNKCSTKLQPAAEGTICGNNRWCFAGKCVDIGERPQSINGEWGQWGEWTACTRSCGAGVTQSQRYCNHPPPSNGGKYCIGERKRFRICNIEACPDGSASFRHKQCADFNILPYKGNKYTWLPVATPDSPCQLHCKPKGMFFSVLLKDMVTDGTPCVPGGRDMCISGRCRHVGCDWEIDSSATEDRCGVCYGDGSSCTTVKQQFNETKKHGYVEATVIPQGARNIRVEEVAEAKNFLALRNEEGEYYLNGHWFIQWSGDYEMAGTVVRYHRRGNKESFQAPGPLKEPLHIMLLMQTHNPGVVFEYTVPKQNATETRKREFRWDFTDWSHCTLSCGGGTQRSEVMCTEKEAGRVDDMFCDSLTKPDDRLRSCNEHLCPARWWTGPWQHCSVTCGDNGTRKRSVMCVRSLGADEQIALEDSACHHLRRPAHTEPCRNKDPCPKKRPAWLTAHWSLCNGNPCATQTRQVLCSDLREGCDPFTKPATSQPCSNITCGTWHTGDWSECSRSCEEGVQYRKVTCLGASTCDLEHEPSGAQPCSGPPCPKPSPPKELPSPTTPPAKNRPLTTLIQQPKDNSIVLKSSDTGLSLGSDSKVKSTNILVSESVADKNKLSTGFSNNNTDLSLTPTLIRKTTGHKHRHHHTINKQAKRNHHRSENAVLNGRKTASENAAPKPVRTTNGRKEYVPVKPNWNSGKEDADDDENVKDSDDVEKRQKTAKKEEEKEFDWYAGEWRKCSSECGGGYQTRTVSCFRTSSRQRADRHLCHPHSKPPSIQECKNDACAQWTTSEWGECSATCGYALRRRSVICPTGGNCSPDLKPREVEVCSSLSSCITWVTGDWSECSKTCGRGSQDRVVQCVNVTSQQVSEACESAFRPPESQSCNTDPCPRSDAAFSVNCESNEMSYRVCRMLKKVGLCHKDYVKTKCCRTCADHSRKSPAKRIADGR